MKITDEEKNEMQEFAKNLASKIGPVESKEDAIAFMTINQAIRELNEIGIETEITLKAIFTIAALLKKADKLATERMNKMRGEK